MIARNPSMMIKAYAATEGFTHSNTCQNAARLNSAMIRYDWMKIIYDQKKYGSEVDGRYS
jgi:hypothetical protein